jgi:two-component system, cell cycle sensor histidine kinase and response regulator CckA
MTKSSRNSARSSGTVLVVDPDHALRTVVRRLLESHDYRVLDAGDSAAAEQIARVYVGPIHLLLVELDLAGASGLALADRLRALHPEPRVVFMSAEPKKELVRKGELVTGLAFIRKPFDGDQLVLTLRAALAAQR